MAQTDAQAARNPLYLFLGGLGLLIFVSFFLPWATVPSDAGGLSVNGTSAGGWGVAALVAAVTITVIACIGYFWNPFSDPEALLIAGFSVATVIGVLIKRGDLAEFIDPSGDYAPDTQVGLGLWLILGAAIVAVLAAAAIVVASPVSASDR